MPTYDYVCDACGHAMQVFQSMSAKKKRKCPECAKPKLRRLIGSGAAVIFKGGGFYETDYKPKSKPPSKDGESGKSGDEGKAKSDDNSTDSGTSKDKAAEKRSDKTSDKSSGSGGDKTKSKSKPAPSGSTRPKKD